MVVVARRNKLPALILMVATLMTASCSYGKRPIAVLGGQAFSLDRARQMKLGMTEAEVRAQLGPPLRLSSDGKRTLWHYMVETTAGEKIKFLGIIAWPAKEYRAKASATLAFADGVLAEFQTSPP
jgi:outer membrane protein assembly factor BamE (lipoprotein component of BamABCDE complex)